MITMEERPPLKTLLFISLMMLLPFFSINVESQQQHEQQPPQNRQQGNAPLTPSPPLLSPPPPLFPPPSPMLRPPSPPLFPPPPPLPLHPPPPFVPPPPRLLSPPLRNSPPPPPPYHLHSPPKFPHELNTNSQLNNHKQHKKKHGSNLNQGQKIGLLFVGIVVILQIGVVGFLAYKRRQLLMNRD